MRELRITLRNEKLKICFVLLRSRDIYTDKVITNNHIFITRQWFTQFILKQETMWWWLWKKLMKQSQVKLDLNAKNEFIYFSLVHSLSDVEDINNDFDCQWSEFRKRKKKSFTENSLNHEAVLKFFMKNKVCFFSLCCNFDLTKMIEERWYRQWETQDKNES